MGTVSINCLILVIVLCALAFFIGRLTSKERRDNKRLRTELEQSREEITEYRSQVANHFRETARRVNVLTENYRDVYDHLARGAKELCDKNNAPELISELKRNPMLAEDANEGPAFDQKPASAMEDAEAGTSDKPLDNRDGSTDAKELQPPAAPQSGQAGGKPQSSDENINSEENSDSRGSIDEVSGLSVEEKIKSG